MKKLLLSLSIIAFLTSCEKPEETYCYEFTARVLTVTTVNYNSSTNIGISKTEKCGITESEAEQIAKDGSYETTAQGSNVKIKTICTVTYKVK